MKLKNKVIRKIMNSASHLPPELHIHMPVITINGQKQIFIEQPYKLMYFAKNEITLQFKDGNVHITGQNFQIKMMYANEFLLEGEIFEIKFNSSNA